MPPQGSGELLRVLSSCLCLVSEAGGATASATDQSTPQSSSWNSRISRTGCGLALYQDAARKIEVAVVPH